MWTREVMVDGLADPETGEIQAEKVKTKKTPAMLLGLAKGVVAHEDVIYFKASA